ncbi:glycosyltransferase family 4 protein [Niveispirillum sp. KHB5.9]|uniref:glycosyltransferase family 4 protein n=1 Tax=Niveispirillum sp. KHB5.9 TaxID=3400269 RepID=UPI003A88155F
MNNPVIGVLGPVLLGDFSDLFPADLAAGGPLRGLGGPPVHLHTRELLRRGHRVILFTFDAGVGAELVLETDRLKICILPYGRHRGRTCFRQERLALLRSLRRERPDILSAHWTYEFALAAIASGIPHVVTAHDAPWRILRHNFIPYRMVRTAMAYPACRGAQRLAAVSPYVAGHLRRFGFRGGAIDIIPNGLPSALFQAPPPRSPGAAPTFGSLFSGGWEGPKNGSTLIEAFALLRRELPQARLLMIGEQCGPAGPAASWARSRGLDAGIVFLGHRTHTDAMALLGGEIDILVHPSLEESFGMTLIEAGFMGLPVIAGQDSGAVPWVLGEGKYGMLVDVRSPAAIAGAMAGLGRNERQRRQLGEAARTAVRERFDIARTTDLYEEIFAQLAHRHD